MVNYWKMFRQILDNAVDVCYVKLLAFWYSHQCMCIGKDATQILSTFVMERLSPTCSNVMFVRPFLLMLYLKANWVVTLVACL